MSNEERKDDLDMAAVELGVEILIKGNQAQLREKDALIGELTGALTDARIVVQAAAVGGRLLAHKTLREIDRALTVTPLEALAVPDLADAVLAWAEAMSHKAQEQGGGAYMTESDFLECNLPLWAAIRKFREVQAG